jgi:hypothetical protein
MTEHVWPLQVFFTFKPLLYAVVGVLTNNLLQMPQFWPLQVFFTFKPLLTKL